jgi:hypothetical protein
MNRGALLAAGLVIAVNAFVLGGVAYNRSQVTEQIELSEYELPLSYATEENSGVGLRMDRIPNSVAQGENDDGFSEDYLKQRGIHVPAAPAGADTFLETPNPRAFVVLEVGGEPLERWLARQEAIQKSVNPNGSVASLGYRTRLIAVDVGADPDALRRRYPDQNSFLIVRTALRLSWYVPRPGTKSEWRGYIAELLPDVIHVPLPFADTLRPLLRTYDIKQPRYRVTVSYGRRYEPWVESVRVQ